MWNVESPDYHNKSKRHTAIERIAALIGICGNEVRKKLHTLRAQYSKERTKMKKSKSGAGLHEAYQTKWEYYRVMQFMFRHNGETETTDSKVIVT